MHPASRRCSRRDRRRTTRALTRLALLGAASAHAAAQDAAHPPPAQRPALQQLRFNEDWSSLRGADRRGLDAIKFIPLSEDESVYLSLGGQARLRAESFSNFNWAPANDDAYLLSRFRAHADLHVGEHFRAFAEMKSAHSTDRDLPGGRRTLDVDSVDIQNLFVDVRVPIGENASVTVRPGRQELLFGRQRLVSPLDWANTRRTFEGVDVIVAVDTWRIHGFWTRPVEVRKYELNRRDDDQAFYGVYAATPIADTRIALDLYWLGLERDNATFGGVMGDESRQTIGARVGGPIGAGGFDFDVEAAGQFGRHAGRDIRAFMVTAETGYFFDAPWRPRIEVGVDYASGDGDPTDGKVGTFNQLFPLGHAFLGYADMIGRQNIIDVRAGFSVRPTSTITISLDGHAFWRADRDDALYNVGGGVARAAAPGASREVGQEIDLTLNFAPARGWQLMMGYSRFFAGDFIDDTGPKSDVHFAFASVQFTF